MPFYKVRAGQEIGWFGTTLKAGAVVNTNISLAKELVHKLEPCTADGESLAHLSAEDLEIAQALPHERITLEARKAAALAALLPPPEPASVEDEPEPDTEPDTAEEEDQ